MLVNRAFEKLGLTQDASLAEVKAAWRRLAFIYHPDREGGDAAEFDLCNKAYQACLVEAAKAKPCKGCGGTGKQMVNSGFTATSISCRLCAGSGVQEEL